MNNINTDINQSLMLNKKFYLDESTYFSIINNVFKNSWQLITDTNSLNKKNIYPFNFLPDSVNEPMILIKDNNIKCISNVCSHRAHLLFNNHCNKKNIRCKYHGRTFNLDGTFKYAPGFDNVNNFPTKNDDLFNFKLIKWNKFLFCGINPKINIMPILNDIEERLPYYKFSNLNYDKKFSNTYIIDAHWALYCENYLEGFHVPFVHKGLTQDIDYDSYSTILIENGVLQIAKSSNDNEAINNTNNIYALYYWILPNLMINIYKWGISINIIEPINKSKTRIKFLSYPLIGETQPTNLDSSLDNVELEDQEVVLNVQKGINSNAYKAGRYSPKYEKGLHHFHILLNKFLN